MRRALFVAALALAGCDRGVEFANLSVTLPEDKGRFPAAPGADACHSPSMILTQPKLKREQWKANIKKMREVYKAPIDPAAEPAILAYLDGVSASIR